MSRQDGMPTARPLTVAVAGPKGGAGKTTNRSPWIVILAPKALTGGPAFRRAVCRSILRKCASSLV